MAGRFGGFGRIAFEFRHLTLELGFALDKYSLLAKNAAASPRVGVPITWRGRATVLRASYNRMFPDPTD